MGSRVELRNVAKRYTTASQTVNAVRSADLTIAAGEFVAVCGPSGCGKSTLLLMTGGLLRPDQGSVILDGTEIYGLSAGERAKYRAENIGFVFQQFHLVPYLSVADNVMSARLGIGSSDRAAVRQRADQLLNRFGLDERRHHRPGQLSVGERQRTALARALLNDPQLLLADEPTGNLDRANADVVLEHLRAFARNGGAVLLVTHDTEAAHQTDRVVQVQEGRIVNQAVSSEQ